MKLHLIIIDGQEDFCNPDWGTLYVRGAEVAMRNVANFIKRCGEKLFDISLTLDSHHQCHIAHAMMWRDRNGNPPAPFTIIGSVDMDNGTWTPKVPGLFKKYRDYLISLEKNGRYPLCIWPPHCLIGTPGHNLIPEIRDAVFEWERKFTAMANKITKGSSPFTEHYGAIFADVPDPSDPSTQVNSNFLNTVNDSDQIIATGIAGSHCLANTIRDMVSVLGNDFAKKMVFFEDCTAPVTGFENLQESMIKDMTALGMQLTNSVDFLS